MAVLTVLIVDDEPMVRSGIRFSLEEAALRTSVVGEAENGTEALEQCTVRLEIRYDEALDETERLVRYIEENFSQPLTLEVLSDRFNFNSKYLSRLIKHKVEAVFSEHLLNLRMKRATELLTKTDMDIKAVALEVGYEDQKCFHRIFKKKTGMTPVQYRRGVDEGKGTENNGVNF